MLGQNPITCNAGGIWDLFALTDVPTYTESCAPVEEQLLLALCGGLGGPRTMQFIGVAFMAFPSVFWSTLAVPPLVENRALLPVGNPL